MLSPKESRYLYGMLKYFYAGLKHLDKPIGGMSEEDFTRYKFLLAGIISMLESSVTLDNEEVHLIKWTMEFMLDAVPEGEWDEHLEKAYFRLFNLWYLDPPYFTKRDGLELPEDFPRDGNIYYWGKAK